jgi:NTE family protein
VEQKLDFRIVGGVSTGALQGVMVAQGEVEKLIRIWEHIRSADDIYTKRDPISAILGPSFNDSTPLRKKLEEAVDPHRIRNSGRQLLVGTVSLQTGHYKTVDQHYENLAEWILASASMPVSFEPVCPKGERQQFVDGGVRHITPISDVIESGADTVLVILTSPTTGYIRPGETFRVWKDIALRAVDILLNEIFLHDLHGIKFKKELVAVYKNLQQVVPASLVAYESPRTYGLVPSQEAADLLDTLEFQPDKIAKLMDVGYETAKDQWPTIKEELQL